LAERKDGIFAVRAGLSRIARLDFCRSAGHEALSATNNIPLHLVKKTAEGISDPPGHAIRGNIGHRRHHGRRREERGSLTLTLTKNQLGELIQIPTARNAGAARIDEAKRRNAALDPQQHGKFPACCFVRNLLTTRCRIQQLFPSKFGIEAQGWSRAICLQDSSRGHCGERRRSGHAKISSATTTAPPPSNSQS